MNHFLDALEEYQRVVRNAPPLVDLRHEEEEKNYSHMGMSSDDEPRFNRFKVTYQKRVSPTQQHDFEERIDLLEFDSRMNHDEFIDWLYAIERIFEYEDAP